MANKPLPSWEKTSREVAARLGELVDRVDQPFADMGDDEELQQVRVVRCLTEARSILTGEWSHRVPGGLIGLHLNQARQIVLDAGLTVRLARRDGVSEGPHGLLGPGNWTVVHTVPAAGNYLNRGDEVTLELAERSTRSPDSGRR